MRRHFHRCMHLRVVSVPASELHGARRGGSVVLEELCEAKGLTRCVGLAECDILTAGQKQELLVERATRIREEEGRPTALSGVSRERAAELEQIRDEMVRERDRILEDNLRLETEIAAAEDRELGAEHDSRNDLGVAGLSLRLDSAWTALRIDRLDELDLALDAMEDPLYGTCVLCGGEIETERLRRFPETHVCTACAREAPARRPIRASRRTPGAGREARSRS